MALPASAACVLSENVLSVRVANAEEQPVAGASIEAVWQERDGTQDMQLTRDTDAAGQARLVIQFDPYSGRSFGGRERCEAKLERVSLRVRKDGYADARMTLESDAFDQPILMTLQTR